MSSKEFELGLSTLINNGILSPLAEIELYNWGEPMLNPELDGILEVLERYDMPFHLSTNGSCIKYFTGDHLKNLTLFMVSLSGFSQSTYGRIHGFDFNNILKNIDAAADILRRNGLLHLMEINFHVYNFNLHEITKARKYFENRGIRFVPRVAYFNDYFLFDGYLNETLPARVKVLAEKHLMIDMLLKEAAFSPKGFSCPQQNLLVADDEWNLVPCCRLSKEERLGSLLDMSLDDIIKSKNSVSYCASCLSSGQSYIVHRDLRYQYGVSDRIVPYRYVPKLLVDYNGKGFTGYSGKTEGEILPTGRYSHKFTFSAAPQKLRLIIPRLSSNVHITDISAVSGEKTFQVTSCSTESEKLKGLFENQTAVFNIDVSGNDIRYINLSFNISYLSNKFVDGIKSVISGTP